MLVPWPWTTEIESTDDGEPTVSLINGATCNARNTAGCAHPPATLHVPGGPDSLAVNETTDTLFVANPPSVGAYQYH